MSMLQILNVHDYYKREGRVKYIVLSLQKKLKNFSVVMTLRKNSAFFPKKSQTKFILQKSSA